MMQKGIFKVALCQVISSRQTIKPIIDKNHRWKATQSQKSFWNDKSMFEFHNSNHKEAASNGADIIVLPEMFVTPYTKTYMLKDKEPLLPDYKTNEACQTTHMLSSLAKSLNKYIVGGSFP